MYKYLLESLLSSVYIPRSKIIGSYGNSMLNSLKNCHTIFHSSHTILCSLPQCTKGSNFSISLSIMGVKYLIVNLICTSLIIHDVEHLFMCLLAIYTSLEKCLFKSFAQFSTSCTYPIWFLLLNFRSSLYILGINPLSDIRFENILCTRFKF